MSTQLISRPKPGECIQTWKGYSETVDFKVRCSQATNDTPVSLGHKFSVNICGTTSNAAPTTPFINNCNVDYYNHPSKGCESYLIQSAGAEPYQFEAIDSEGKKVYLGGTYVIEQCGVSPRI